MTIETILAIGAGVRAAPGNLLPGSGDSFTLRAPVSGSDIYLVDVLLDIANASNFELRSPRMHDNVSGLRFDIFTPTVCFSALRGIKQPMFGQDNLQFIGGIGGGAATYDLMAASIYYESLIGSPGNFYHWDNIMNSIKNLLTIKIVPVGSFTGDWDAGVALNSTNDLLKANTNYAILGALCVGTAGIVGFQGQFTGNVRLGVPIYSSSVSFNSSYLVDLSRNSGLATIPVFSSADKAGVFVYTASQSGITNSIDILCAELEGSL